MLKRYKEDANFRHFFWLTVIYVLAHWFILVSTGRWWDDWVYADHDVEYVMDVFMQSSLPLAGVVNIIIWYIPYKLFVFLMFYADGIFLYKILKSIDLISEEAAFWISALFLIIPVNDARIAYICFNYSLGLFCYLLSFYLITRWVKQEGKKRVATRILSLLILVFAFNAESVMLMVVLMLLYLYYEELKTAWEWKEITLNIRKIFVAIIHYIDYLIIPVANYFVPKILFPGYGMYAGHSYIGWDTLPHIIINSPKYTWLTFKNIFSNWGKVITEEPKKIVLYIVVYAVVIGAAYLSFIRRKKPDQYEKNGIGKTLLLLCLGILAFYLGVFPYIVKRGRMIDVVYSEGRDSLLLGIGVAIIIYYFLYLFRFLVREGAIRMILVFLTVSGIIYFNNIYLEWEKNYYQQLQIRDEIASNQQILDNDNFIVIYTGSTFVNMFYQTNGNSWMVTGEETRFYMSGVDDLVRLLKLDKDSWYINFMMKDFDYTDKTIDGVIYVNYNTNHVGRATVLKQKWNEFFNTDAFNQWIREVKDIKYYPITPEQSDAIIEAYRNGDLTDENLINYVCPDSVKDGAEYP